MPIEKIAEIILSQGLWQSRGKTPKVSIGSRLYCDMKHAGVKSRFIKTHAGTIDLRYTETLFSSLDGFSREGLSPQEWNALKKYTLEVAALSDEAFEGMIRKILERQGVREIVRIRRAKEDEINLEGYVTILDALSIRIRVLAARWKRGKVTVSAIDRIRRDLAPGDRSIVFSLYGFCDDAIRAAEADGEPPIILFSAEDLIKMQK